MGIRRRRSGCGDRLPLTLALPLIGLALFCAAVQWTAAVVLPAFRLGERMQERLQERTMQRLVVALGALGALLALRTGIGLLLG